MEDEKDEKCEEYLKRTFKHFGTVLAATVRRKKLSKTWALISFATAAEARRAIAASPLSKSGMVIGPFEQDTASTSVGKMGETLRKHRQKITDTVNESPAQDGLLTPAFDYQAGANAGADADDDRQPLKRRPRKLTRFQLRSGSTRAWQPMADSRDDVSHHQCRLQLSGQ